MDVLIFRGLASMAKMNGCQGCGLITYYDLWGFFTRSYMWMENNQWIAMVI